jgi:hypothetical protein
VLNCVGICRQVKVKLHEKTIQNFLSSRPKGSISVFDFASSSLINKKVTSCLCFVENVNDNKIIASEVVLDEMEPSLI